VPSGPANVGGLNNSGNDPSGAGNSAKLSTAPGTNSAGTAQSSGSGARAGAAANSGAGVTTGSAPQQGVDGAIADENKAIDRKLNSICRGC
jgi:hypothetical protein